VAGYGVAHHLNGHAGAPQHKYFPPYAMDTFVGAGVGVGGHSAYSHSIPNGVAAAAIAVPPHVEFSGQVPGSASSVSAGMPPLGATAVAGPSSAALSASAAPPFPVSLAELSFPRYHPYAGPAGALGR